MLITPATCDLAIERTPCNANGVVLFLTQSAALSIEFGSQARNMRKLNAARWSNQSTRILFPEKNTKFSLVFVLFKQCQSYNEEHPFHPRPLW